MAEKENQPVKKFQIGVVGVALWKNTIELKDGQKMDVLSATVDRRYKDKNGEWKSSKSIQMNDVPRAILALGKAYDYMVSKNKNSEQIVEEEVVM